MLLEYDRPVPPGWAERLASITPPSERISYLQLVWESGDLPSKDYPEGRPVQRWVLYEVTPAAGVPWWKRDDLLETPVASAGHQRILDFYRESGGCLMEPFWVIQGDQGGHKYEFNDTEKNLLYLAGLPWEAPASGSLPYAPFDERVVRQVMRWDRLRKGYASLKMANELITEDAKREFREKLLDFLSLQVQHAVEEIAPVINDNTIGVDDRSPVPDFEEIDRRFVETGALT